MLRGDRNYLMSTTLLCWAIDTKFPDMTIMQGKLYGGGGGEIKFNNINSYEYTASPFFSTFFKLIYLNFIEIGVIPFRLSISV